ncbi:MAG TPA: hypothetical protein VNR89_04125 [Roseomonas sp.]|nr:hypothetical protein [Roseomonas sp.]
MARRSAAYRQQNALVVAERRKPYRKDTIGELLDAARKRAKRKGLPCTLRRPDIPPIPARCPVLGIPLTRGIGVLTDNSPSLDRIIAALGYVPGNVRWVSHRYNRLRSDMTLEECELILADLRAILP